MIPTTRLQNDAVGVANQQLEKIFEAVVVGVGIVLHTHEPMALGHFGLAEIKLLFGIELLP
jgi:hypothetical protein